MRILLIADYLPYPLVGGDRIRIYNLLRRVANHHEVSLACFLEKPEEIEGVSHLKQFCARIEVSSLHRQNRLSHIPGLLRYALEGKPPELKFIYSADLTEKIRQMTSTMDFDIVQIEHARMGLYLEALPKKKSSKTLLMFHNFTFQQFNRISQVQDRWDQKIRPMINSMTMGRWEPLYAQRFDRCTTVSEIDRDLLLKSNPRLHVDVIPNGVDIGKYHPLPSENTSPVLLFIGNMSYGPCVDAVVYFCREIFPLIRGMVNTAEFWIVGRDPTPEVLQLKDDNIHVTGQVEDVLPYYRQTAVCVVPLRAGGGTRLKILEAMALARPVVSTTIGSEGLDAKDGEHLLLADTPKQFAEKTVRLLSDHQLYQHITNNGRRLVEDYYDWDKIAGRLMEVYTNMLEQPDFA